MCAVAGTAFAAGQANGRDRKAQATLDMRREWTEGYKGVLFLYSRLYVLRQMRHFSDPRHQFMFGYQKRSRKNLYLLCVPASLQNTESEVDVMRQTSKSSQTTEFLTLCCVGVLSASGLWYKYRLFSTLHTSTITPRVEF